VIEGDAVVLPLSWRSYGRATFFTSMLLVFGGGALFGSDGVLRIVGLAFVVIGLIVGSDFALFTRRWRLAEQQLHVPRAWSPSRALGVSPRWKPDLNDVGVRDSMFVCTTPDGNERVTPNLMVARSDVMQWLYLIGEASTTDR
jgi:hypothetical protein